MKPNATQIPWPKLRGSQLKKLRLFGLTLRLIVQIYQDLMRFVNIVWGLDIGKGYFVRQSWRAIKWRIRSIKTSHNSPLHNKRRLHDVRRLLLAFFIDCLLLQNLNIHRFAPLFISLVRCPGQNKRIAPLCFLHGYRKRRLKVLQ
jgi:hypothetical protein